MKFELPKNVNYIISRLASCGYRADAVGGCVRDLLLGKSPSDYDLTTDATPEKIKEIFANERTVDTGIKHGTVSIILEGEQFEVTTYRVDGEYKDSRHPESVSFTRDIRDDLSRRDFTVNAIAYSSAFGLTDLFGGREDLENEIIRAVGDPYLRFTEDALRILRALRFSSTLGFSIEPNTARALREKKNLLTNVSAERIYVELRKLIEGKNAYNVLSEYGDVISVVLPEIFPLALPEKSLFERSDFICRLLSMLYLSGGSLDSLCQRLHTESHLRQLGGRVISAVDKYTGFDDVKLTHILAELDVEGAETLLRLEILLGRLDPDALKRLDVLKSNAVYKLSQLEIDGGDLISLGARGRRVGEILNLLLTAVIDGKMVNNKEKLLKMAEELVKMN